MVGTRIHLTHERNHAEDCNHILREEEGMEVQALCRDIEVIGDELSEEQRAKIIDIADKGDRVFTRALRLRDRQERDSAPERASVTSQTKRVLREALAPFPAHDRKRGQQPPQPAAKRCRLNRRFSWPVCSCCWRQQAGRWVVSASGIWRMLRRR